MSIGRRKKISNHRIRRNERIKKNDPFGSNGISFFLKY